MSKQKHDRISVEEARLILEKEGLKLKTNEVQLILDFLSEIAEILVANGINKS